VEGGVGASSSPRLRATGTRQLQRVPVCLGWLPVDGHTGTERRCAAAGCERTGSPPGSSSVASSAVQRPACIEQGLTARRCNQYYGGDQIMKELQKYDPGAHWARCGQGRW
jgi:hypothetical protein